MTFPKVPARFSLHLAISASLLILMAVFFALHARSQRQIGVAHELRFESYRLADELRQNSDDFTRMVRIYVATSNPVYKQHFQEIMDIRNGVKPRPDQYSRIYWDLLLPGGEPPRPETAQKIPLLELMRQKGFAEDEFRKLEEANAKSNELTAREVEAMKLVESGGPDIEAKRARAMLMLTDEAYLRAKAGIMKPIDDFYGLLDKRTLAAVLSAEKASAVLCYASVAFGLGLMVMLGLTYGTMRGILGGSLDEIHSNIVKIGSGDFDEPDTRVSVQKNSVMDWLALTRNRLNEISREQTRVNSELHWMAAIVESTDDAVIGKTLDGIITNWNPAAERLLGYTAAETVGRPMQEIFSPEPVHDEGEILARIRRGERVESFEIDRRRKDGSLVHVAVTVSPIKDKNGHVVGASRIARDITKRKQAEAERDRFFTLSLDPLCIANTAGYFRRLNPAFERILGFSVEELLGRPFLDFIHPEDVPATMKVVETLATGAELVDFENRYRCKDGTYRWFLWTCAPYPEEGLLYSSARDITERKQFEAKILQMNRELEQRVVERTVELKSANATLLSKQQLIAAIHEAQTEFITESSSSLPFNRLLDALLKLTGSEYGFIDEMFLGEDGQPYLTARAITDISWNDQTKDMYTQFVSGELRFTKLKSLFGEVMTTGRAVIANDAPNDPRRGGTPVGHPGLNAFLGLPLHSSGQLVGVIGLANRPNGYTDEVIEFLQPIMTACANLIVAHRIEYQRRTAEESLRQMNATLERQSNELVASNKELEAFSYSVSHDLRAPLRSIDSFSRIVIEDYREKLDVEGQRLLNIVRSEAQRMGQLIDDLLSFSRLGRQELMATEFDMASLAQDVYDELPESFRQHVKRFTIGPLPPAYGDRSMIRQVLYNLLGNAVKFTGSTLDPEIEVRGDTIEGVSTYSVKDNGAGFDPRYTHKLFGVFQRLHTESEFEGTGVGLALVQRIIHRHGGRVWADGQPNQGATFCFSLPTNIGIDHGESNHGKPNERS